MSHDPNKQSVASLSRGSVMDIRPRRIGLQSPKSPSATRQTEIAVKKPVPVAPQPETLVVQKPVQPPTAEPIESLLSNADEAPMQPTSQEMPRIGLSKELLAQAESEVKQEELAKQQLLEMQKKQRKGPLIASVVAIIVALTLAYLAVNIYMQTNATTRQPAPSTSLNDASGNADGAANNTPASVIDAATKDIEAITSAKEAGQELPDSGLNEQAIGL